MLTLLFAQPPDVTVSVTGVAAAPAIGTVLVDVSTAAVSGVAATPAIGAVLVSVSTAAVSGVAAAPAIGSVLVDVSTAAVSGVAAAPAIGAVTVTADSGTIPEVPVVTGGGVWDGWFPILRRRKKSREPLRHVFIECTGVAAAPAIGEVVVIADALVFASPGAASVAAMGSVTVTADVLIHVTGVAFVPSRSRARALVLTGEDPPFGALGPKPRLQRVPFVPSEAAGELSKTPAQRRAESKEEREILALIAAAL